MSTNGEPQGTQNAEPKGLLGNSGLMERLSHVQKRKRAFAGQTGEAYRQAIRRQLETGRQGQRER